MFDPPVTAPAWYFDAAAADGNGLPGEIVACRTHMFAEHDAASWKARLFASLPGRTAVLPQTDCTTNEVAPCACALEVA